MFKFNLGDEVQDQITKFKGIIRGRADYLTGCTVYGIQSVHMSKNASEIPKWVWIDEPLLKLIKASKIKLKSNDEQVGGPHSSDQFAPTQGE